MCEVYGVDCVCEKERERDDMELYSVVCVCDTWCDSVSYIWYEVCV